MESSIKWCGEKGNRHIERENLLKEGRAQVRILKTQDKWIGVTYKEDMPIAKESFRALIQSGTYRENLYEDLQ